MPSLKISALTNGVTAAGADLHVVARGGVNRKLTTLDVFAETLDLAAFQTKASAGQLIPGRTYRVTGVTGGGDAVAVADSPSTVQNVTNLELPGGTLVAALWSTGGFWDPPLIIWDSYGQEIRQWDATNSWPLNSSGFRRNLVYSAIYNGPAYPGGGAVNVQECEIMTSLIQHAGLYLYQCHLSTSTITSAGGTPTQLQLTDCTLQNCQLLDTDDKGGTLTNCHFENVVVQLKNNPTVTGLRIFGKTNSANSPAIIYEIDGTYQSQVVNEWSGTVVADEIFGSSTVTFLMNWTAGADTTPGTLNPDSSFVNYLPASPVGVYLMPTFTGSDNYSPGDPFELQYFTGPTNHPLMLRVENMTAGTQPSLKLYAAQTGLTGQQCSEYHGITTKVHQLFHRNCWVEMYYGPAADDIAHWFLKTGAHYDL